MTPGPRDAAYRFAERMWSDSPGVMGRAVSFGLIPVSGAWRAGVWWRNRRFDGADATTIPGVRVISVGNLAVGGTGKTPIASWMAGVVTGAGCEPTILRRDHGDDESHLHRLWRPETPVLAGPDRVALAAKARDAGADVVVLDDGFQHRQLARDLDIVLLAVEDGVSGPLMPRGRFREPLSAVRRADIIVLTRRGATLHQARRVAEGVARLAGTDTVVQGCVRLSPGPLRAFAAWEVAVEAGVGQGKDFAEAGAAPRDGARVTVDSPVVVTAVARPRAVLRDVASVCSGAATLLAFPDHHAFSAADVARIRRVAGERPVVVTEKDAVKLRQLTDLPGDMWVLGQELIWDWGITDVKNELLDLASAARR